MLLLYTNVTATIKQRDKKNKHTESMEADEVQTLPWAISAECRLNIHISFISHFFPFVFF